MDFETINIDQIDATDRVRKDLGAKDGSFAGLKASIKEYGIIQPIVIARCQDSPNKFILIAGGRRFTCLRELNFRSLRHGKEFIYRDEVSGTDTATQLRLGSIELEENLKRKELSWQEIAFGKAKLLKIMQELHGQAQTGRPSVADKANAAAGSAPVGGFGVRKLAAMLGEDASNTSRDLKLATALTAAPFLRNLPTRQDALKRVDAIVKQMSVPVGAAAAAAIAAPALKYRIIIECRDETEQKLLLEEFAQRGLKCQASIY